MPRKVFFSFHYQRDCWRVSQVRNSWLCRPGNTAPPFKDRAEWESILRQGDRAVKNWIDTQMAGSSVTVVLIGRETYTRPFVKYEIEQSLKLRKGLVGVFINSMRNAQGQTDLRLGNPFDAFTVPERDRYGYVRDVPLLSSTTRPVRCYDYVYESGYHNLSAWVEEAARAVGR